MIFLQLLKSQRKSQKLHGRHHFPGESANVELLLLKKNPRKIHLESKAPPRKRKCLEQHKEEGPNAPIVKTTPPSPAPSTTPPPETKPAPIVQKSKSTTPILVSRRKPKIVKKVPREVSDAARSAAVEESKAYQMSLAPGTPSIVKSMVPSHVERVFWLGLPRDFCNANLPKKKLKIMLEDEQGKVFDVVCIPERCGLSGGWNSFAHEKKLHNGDAVLLERTEPKRLKVHVFRAAENSS